MSALDRETHRADVVILTAIRLEFNAVLKVDTGAVPNSMWLLVKGPSGLPVAFRPFVVEHGRPLRVAVAVAPDTRAAAATKLMQRQPVSPALGERPHLAIHGEQRLGASRRTARASRGRSHDARRTPPDRSGPARRHTRQRCPTTGRRVVGPAVPVGRSMTSRAWDRAVRSTHARTNQRHARRRPP